MLVGKNNNALNLEGILKTEIFLDENILRTDDRNTKITEADCDVHDELCGLRYLFPDAKSFSRWNLTKIYQFCHIVVVSEILTLFCFVALILTF